MLRHTHLVILRLTRDCNLNCKYCFMVNKGDFKGEIISFDEIKYFTKELIKHRLLNKTNNFEVNIVFHGGEPLLIGADRLEKYLRYMTTMFINSKVKWQFALQTNATLLNDRITSILSKYNVRLGMSFDSVDNAERDVKQNIFEQKFDLLKKYNIEYGFIVVGGKHNIDSMSETKEYLLNLKGITGYKVNYAEDMKNTGDVELSGFEFFNKVYKPELEQFIKTGIDIKETRLKELLDMTLIDIMTKHEADSKSGCGSLFCGAAINMIGINPDGSAHYCDRYDREYEETYVMNIKDEDFLGLTQIKRAIDFNIERHNVVLKQGCDDCKARYICDGGCAAFYYSKHKNNGIDEDLVCNLYKQLYEYIENNIHELLKRYNEISSNDTIIKCNWNPDWELVDSCLIKRK